MVWMMRERQSVTLQEGSDVITIMATGGVLDVFYISGSGAQSTEEET